MDEATRAESARGGPEREHPGCVIGIGVGLFLLLGLMAALVFPRGGPRDAGKLLEEWMPGGVPQGFVVDSAHVLLGGETVLRLEANRDESSDASTRLSAGPEELVLIRYRSNRAAEADMRGSSSPNQGRPGGGMQKDPGEQLERWERERDFALQLTVDKGEIAWDAWRAARATERSMREDGTWCETVRVNLSQPDRFLILFAQWPEGVSAEPDLLKPILSQIAMAPAG